MISNLLHSWNSICNTLHVLHTLSSKAWSMTSVLQVFWLTSVYFAFPPFIYRQWPGVISKLNLYRWGSQQRDCPGLSPDSLFIRFLAIGGCGHKTNAKILKKNEMKEEWKKILSLTQYLIEFSIYKTKDTNIYENYTSDYLWRINIFAIKAVIGTKVSMNWARRWRWRRNKEGVWIYKEMYNYHLK